jgi:hypothetical protein
MRVGVTAVALTALLVIAPAAMATSAVDQYSEGIPTAGGQKPSHNAVRQEVNGKGNTATIPPAAVAQLEKSKNGRAAAAAAKITAPSDSSPGGSPTNGSGLGLLLPLILAATLLAAIAVFLARRRATPS